MFYIGFKNIIKHYYSWCTIFNNSDKYRTPQSTILIEFSTRHNPTHFKIEEFLLLLNVGIKIKHT